MADTNQKWMVTFYYKQALRSKYMNGLLNSVLKPGVHDGVMSLYTEESAVGASASSILPGLYLYIKQGTSLIFSNAYKRVNGAYERDFDNIGTFLIKCTALRDISMPLATWDGAGVISDEVQSMFGPDRPKTMYIASYLRYNPEDVSSADLDDVSPEFKLVIRNEKYSEEIKTKESIYFRTPYTPIDPETGEVDISKDALKLPDGSTNYFGNINLMRQLSWLNLGAVIEKAGVPHGYSYITKNNWVTKTTSGEQVTKSNGAISWVQDHVFTARGQQEYRQDLSKESFQTNPDFILSNDCHSLYLDTGYVFDNEAVYKSSAKWLDVQEFGSTTAQPKADFDFTLPRKGTTTPDTSMSALLAAYVATHPELEHTVFPVVLMDAVFATSNQKTSNSPVAVDEILQDGDYEKLSNPLNLISYRWLATPGSCNMHPSFDSEVDKASFDAENTLRIHHRNFQYLIDKDDIELLKGKMIVPLDTCSANIERLLPILANRKVIPVIVDAIRGQNMIDSVKTTSLIPVCLAFRKFNISKYTKDSYHIESVDGFSSESVIHPANILSLFDLQNASTQLNCLNFKSEDVYTIIPIVE